MEIIKVKKTEAEFYQDAQKANDRYDKLVKEGKEVFLDPILKGKLWVITYKI